MIDPIIALMLFATFVLLSGVGYLYYKAGPNRYKYKEDKHHH